MNWHVGAIMNEPKKEVLRFVAWYLRAGASGFTIFFDNPDDPAAAILEKHPKIRCIRCTPEFWKSIGTSQGIRFPKRQNLALTWLYKQSPAEWLLNVDADEFVYIPDQSIESFLTNQPAETESIRLQTAEILMTDGPEPRSHYRTPMERDSAWRVYGEAGKFFGPKRKGLVGHPQGKSFVRCGIEDFYLRQHWPESSLKREVRETFIPASSGYALLHHIGDSYKIWRNKVQWRIGSRGFTTPFSETVRTALTMPDAEDRIKALYLELHGCSDARLEALKAENAYFHAEVRPDSVAEQLLGQIAAT